LPQLKIALEPVRHPEFIRHPTIRTDAEGVIAGLSQDFWEQRIALRIR
jgi:hypothetical protein